MILNPLETKEKRFDKNGKYIPNPETDAYGETYMLTPKQRVKRKRAKAARKARRKHI